MEEQRNRTATLFFTTIRVGVLCLCQITCNPDGGIQDAAIDPGKFALHVEDKSTNRNNFVVVRITPGSPSMDAGEFWVTASVAADQGTVKGATNDKGGKKLNYTEDLHGCSVAALSYSVLKAKQDDQGDTIVFRAQVIPGATIKLNDRYTLLVSVTREDDGNPHTETRSVELVAKRDGIDKKEASQQESTSDTSTQPSPTGTSDAIPDDITEHIRPPTPDRTLPIPVEEISPHFDADLATTPHAEVLDARLEETSDPCANTITYTDIEEGFSVALKVERRGNSVKNFALVTVKPNKDGMELKRFAVTAHLEPGSGIVKGSSGKHGNSFTYGKVLNNCSLDELFLTDKQSNCLEGREVSFARGEGVAFRIEIDPGSAAMPGNQYTLVIQVTYTGSTPHVETLRETLTVPQASPVKRPKQSPRKSG